MSDVLYVGHFWSLAVEEQFYLIWPAIILLGSTGRSIRICGWIFSLSPLGRLAAVWGGAGWAVTYEWTPLRADGLVVGALLALVQERTAVRSQLVRWSLVAAAAAGSVLFWVAWTDRAGLVFHPLESVQVGVVRV